MSDLDPHHVHIISKDKVAKAFRARKKGDNTHVTVKSAVLRDVSFVQTGRRSTIDLEYEEGFGCGIVAMGCPADAPSTEGLDLQEIYFDGANFRCQKGDFLVTSAKLVFLDESQIRAVL